MPSNNTVVAVSYARFFDYLLFTFIVCSVASLAGNIIVIIAIYRNKRLRNTQNYFIINMAVSDVFMPAIQLLRVIVFLRKDAGHLSSFLGAGLCKFTSFFSYVSAGVSILSFIVITVHRFYAVVYPTKKALNRTRAWAFLLACTWLVPAVVFCPRIYFVTFGTKFNSCRNTMPELDRKIYNVFIFIMFTALPLVLMLVFYPIIVVKLRKKKLTDRSMSSHGLKQHKWNIRLTKMFVTLIGLYFLTWFTYKVAGFVAVYSKNADKVTMRKLRFVVSALPSMFHAINPVIYFLFWPSFRKELRRILCCFCCDGSSTSRPTMTQELI